MTQNPTHPNTGQSKAIKLDSNHLLFSTKTAFTLLLGICYALLFYNMEIGLNVLVFDVLLLAFFLRTEPDIKQRPLFTIVAAGLLVSAVSVVIVNSYTASLAHIVSLLLLFGVARVREIKFIWFALLLGIFGIFRVPLDYIDLLKKSVKSEEKDRAFKFRYILIPILIGIPFLAIYYQANANFASVVDQILNLRLFVSGRSFWLFVWGSWLAAILLFPFSRNSRLAVQDQKLNDNIDRHATQPINFIGLKQHMLSLKYEFQIARASFIGLNVLLLLVNCSDILGLLFFRQAFTASEFSEAVHSGTYLLMLSIILAIAVVLYFFRGRLNFYPKVASLRKLAFFWIAQNGLLALIVGMRNLLYVHHAGLAWGRVLVFFFLLLIGFGLYTLYRKVNLRLSTSYLLNTNGMALWMGLLLLGAINWDGVITRYNMATQSMKQLDLLYLAGGLGDGNAFLLARNKELRARFAAPDQRSSYQYGNAYNNFEWKLNPHNHRYADWRSWNYKDYRNQKTTKKYGPLQEN